jgi:predicted ATPase
MRREEAVFYAGSERVLRASDWAVLMAGPEQRDPAGDLARLAARYPRLAARLSQPERQVSGAGETRGRACDGARHFLERIVETYGMLAHETIEVTRSNLAALRGVRTPLELLRTAGSIRARSARLAARVVAHPFRR